MPRARRRMRTFCDLCLPVLGEKVRKTKYLISVSKKKHIRVDCQKNDKQVHNLLQYHYDYVKKHSKFERRNSIQQQVARRLEDRMQYARERGHDPVIIFMDWAKVKKPGTCTIVCKCCKTDIGSYHRDKVHIPCAGTNEDKMGYAPGVKFWQALLASDPGKLEIARDSLEMQQDEVDKALQAVEDYLERQRKRAEQKQRRMEKEAGSASKDAAL